MTDAEGLPRRKAAVLGRPIAHSLSPVLHNAAYAALGLPWTYTAIDCGEHNLSSLLAGSGPEWVGFSLTMPLKRQAVRLADQVDGRAVLVGAANTLLPDGEGGWWAGNTDVDGILRAVTEHGIEPGGLSGVTRTATVLGAGGTAQAALVALSELGLADCTVLVRDPERVGELAATAQRAGVDLSVERLASTSTGLAADVVISTLPAGAADIVDAYRWRADQVVLDVVYDPWPTALAEAARAAGAVVVSGALMLLHQAAVQVELMTGEAAPLSAMREALRLAVGTPGVV